MSFWNARPEYGNVIRMEEAPIVAVVFEIET